MIFVISGQTASGKTTLALEIAEKLKLERLISHTTRPMRIGEKDGVEYHFITNEQLIDVNLVCKNVFHTVHGDWTYGLNIDQLNLDKHYIAILEAAGARELKRIVPSSQIIYIDVSQRERKKRAYARENKKIDPEIERRFKADAEDFLNFKKYSNVTVLNIDKQKALNKIEKFILKKTKTKYGAKKVVVNNISFDSKMESDFYLYLLELQKQGIVKDFEMQPAYELLPAFVINGKKRLPIKYKADFIIYYTNNTVEVVDIKGFETVDFKLKKKMFEHKFKQELKCITMSMIDGGWIELEQLKKNRAARKKIKKAKAKEIEENE